VREEGEQPLFLAVDGNAAARNILFDGNAFRNSHSVDKKPFVADLIGGIGMIIHRVKITYSYVHRTKEFETQKEEQNFEQSRCRSRFRLGKGFLFFHLSSRFLMIIVIASSLNYRR